MKNSQKHNWVKEGASKWRCVCCHVVKEQKSIPRTEKYLGNKHYYQWSINGRVLDTNPFCNKDILIGTKNMKKEYLKKEEYIYMDLTILMNDKTMANVLYAAIKTQADFPTIWSMSAYEYDRAQNKHNEALIKVHIHPSQVTEFELISGRQLRKPQQVGF